ncbi:hypothetical protein [Rhizobium sp. S96]|uniref:hypothetical protein n=1 Tax=Rhizobium sp. S96 TaxID=3055140 RepID=UPI0025AA4ADD|nr:hypothetical protein [Rhizobium sp. S96]MDM9622185.1 hypothetical protein [Rhizobium sp. S96]
MQDMTISEILRDPLIRQVLHADGTSLTSFARLLKTAARERRARQAHENSGDDAMQFLPTTSLSTH